MSDVRRLVLVAAASALVVVVLGLLAVPVGAVFYESFALQVRVAERRARQRIAAIERAARPRRFAYYTVGSTWKYTGATGWAAGYVPGGLWSWY